MSQIVVYWSQTGNTEAIANKIASSLGVSAKSVNEVTPEEVSKNDVIVLGCPAMGAEELEDSEFRPFFESVANKAKDKKFAFFGSYGWGGGEWMQNWVKEAKDLGLNVLNDGLISNGGIDEIEGDFDSYINDLK